MKQITQVSRGAAEQKMYLKGKTDIAQTAGGRYLHFVETLLFPWTPARVPPPSLTADIMIIITIINLPHYLLCSCL